MSSTKVNFPLLNKENYDTWKSQMCTLLNKNGVWGYVNGKIEKPEVKDGDSASASSLKKWILADLKAQSDIVLAIEPSEIEQIKGCTSSKAIWAKLVEIYKSPARDAALLDQSTKAKDDGDIRQNSNRRKRLRDADESGQSDPQQAHADAGVTKKQKYVPAVVKLDPSGKLKLKRNLIQQHLMTFMHAVNCQRSKQWCNLQQCKAMKKVLIHMRSCSAGKRCAERYCNSSRLVLGHWRHCQSDDCPVCLPFKHIEKNWYFDSHADEAAQHAARLASVRGL